MSQEHKTHFVPKRRIPIAGPWVSGLEVNYVADAAANAWYENADMYNIRFERAFEDYLGIRHAVTLPSCTSGIHLALAALGVGVGDEVIVPETTWIASSAPISYVGATPVFVDVDPVTWCLSPESLQRAITPRTRAVIVVDLYGNMAEFDEIEQLARVHNFKVIEDSAESIGAVYRGRRSGTLGDVAVFSFHGSKTLTTGEGGMLVTNDTEFFNRVNFLRDHGRAPADFTFENTEVAFKYKMSGLQAAFGLAQLERMDEIVERKRIAFQWYEERLGEVEGIRINQAGPNVESAYWLVSAVWADELAVGKVQIRDLLASHHIDTRPFFSPLSSLAAYRNLRGIANYRVRNPVSYRLGRNGINLPSSLVITQDEVDYVCDKFISAMSKDGQGPDP